MNKKFLMGLLSFIVTSTICLGIIRKESDEVQFPTNVYFNKKVISTTNGVADNGIANQSLGFMAAKSVKINATGSSAAPTDMVAPGPYLYLRSNNDGTALLWTNFGQILGDSGVLGFANPTNIFISNGDSGSGTGIGEGIAGGETKKAEWVCIVWTTVDTGGAIHGINMHISGDTDWTDGDNVLVYQGQLAGWSDRQSSTINILIPAGVYWRCTTNQQYGAQRISVLSVYTWPFY